jgi:oxygen-dependent protoporphyrinogen oxidase
MFNPLLKNMLGSPLPPADNAATIHIVGAGIAGLLLGYYLKKSGKPFVIYENSPRAGGRLATLQTPFGIVEMAANGMMRCAELDEIVETLGLDWLMPLPDNKKRYIVRNHTLRRFPLSVAEALKAVFNFVRPHHLQQPIVTLRDFAHTYFSPIVAAQLVEPALQGIYTGELHELGFAAVMPLWAKVQQNKQSMAWALLKNRWATTNDPTKPNTAKWSGTASFAGGMQTFIDALAAYLSPHIQYNTDGIALLAHKPAQQVVLCAPAFEAARYFEPHPIANLLRQIEYIPLLSATFFVPKNALTRFKAGFGCLIPRNEGYQMRGILFNHCIFEGRTVHNDHASLTCIATDKHTANLSNDAVIALLTQELEKLLGLNQAPLHVQLTRYAKGIPLYSPNLPALWTELDDLLQRDFAHVRLLGNYTSQLSIRNMSKAIAQMV